MVMTIDLLGGRNLETSARGARLDERECSTCHIEGDRKPIYEGLPALARGSTRAPAMTWDYVARLKDATSMKVGLKGIVTREDAELCVQSGVDVIVVSNHGGRAEPSARSTIECLPEIVEAVGGRIPIIIDSGFRRGTDIFKGLALGATAVGIGRPYLWGLAAFGQEGVEAVLELLRRELRLVMRQAGATAIDRIGPSHVIRRA
jgi:isopentenyl diphosphate isomerase/L-lactate dehydrogenase-like FMN-dependent dehydrogenase